MLQGSRDGTYLKEEKRPTIYLIYIHEKTSLTCILLFILETNKVEIFHLSDIIPGTGESKMNN